MPAYEDEEEVTPQPASVAAPAPEPVVEAAAPAPAAEDFKNDPLIREALEAFEARIIKS